MKILYLTTSFPEEDKGATIYTDLAEALYEAGHEVTVAVSEQPKNRKKSQINKERGLDVLRIVTGNYYDIGFIEKGFTTLKIPILMKRNIKKYFKDRNFDLILYESPPTSICRVVSWAKKYFQCTTYLMLKDIFPQNAVDLNIIKKNGFIHHFFKTEERKLYQISDHIGCMSKANEEYIISHNSWINATKVELFPNTKKLSSDINKDGCCKIRMQYGIPKESCLFLLGGNMGKPQYVDLICNAIKECKEEIGIFFLFIGRGTDRHIIEQTILDNKISNALVIENLPRDKYEQFIKECDVGLIVLSPKFTIPNYPSRILSYMEYAKPVLAATDKVSDIRNLIEDAQCGEWVWSGDSELFIKKAKGFANKSINKDKGINGRIYIEEKLAVQSSVEIINNIIF